MASQSVPKMSLVAQNDDLCRYIRVLTAGCVGEFKTSVVGQTKLLNKWKENEAEIQVLKTQFTVLQTEKNLFECQMKYMRNNIEEEVMKRKKLESEKSSMERQITLIKEVLLADGTAIDNQTKEKLFTLSNASYRRTSDTQIKFATTEESIGSLSSSDIDETEDLDIDATRRRKRRSKDRKSSGEPYQKQKKSDTKLQRPSNDGFTTDTDTTLKKKENFRSNSEPSSNSLDLPSPRVAHKSDSGQIETDAYDLRIHKTGTMSGGILVGRYSTGEKLSCTHAFVSKIVIRNEKCYSCGKVIKFCKQALRCSDCRITCHLECKKQCPLPCVPVTYTPTKNIMGIISDYTSSTPPMIPSLVVHCLNEIESRGLKEIGLYRVSGSEREIKYLKDKLLKGRSVNSLNRADIHAVCGTVKEFLRSLKDSLITRAAWQVFVDSAEHGDEKTRLNSVYQAVCELPQPNKETLAFLILHLQRVTESIDCRMPLENLSKIFGPTIVGYSCAEPSDSNILTETSQQCQVMQCLLMIPSDMWQTLLNIELPEVFHNLQAMITPECSPAIKASRLVPILPAADRKWNVRVERTPLSPRNRRNATKKGKNLFRSSLPK